VDEKSVLLEYLRARRDDLLAKLDGLGEYDVRRPMTPTGTNLLGLVRHVAYVQLGYFGEVFGRPSGRAYPWDDGGEPDADIVRELIDGSVGVSSPGDNLPERSATEWAAFRARIEAAARQAAGSATPSGAGAGDG
jgi:hypothetical protein